MVMKPFELHIELKSPMVLGKNPIRLEGLLWHCLYLDGGCPVKAQENLSDYLKFTGRFYHASSSAFGVRRSGQLVHPSLENAESKKVSANNQDVIGVVRTTIGSMTHGDLNASYFAPNGKRKNQPYTKPVIGGGRYGTRLVDYRAYWAESLVFHGMGKGGAIADLCQFYLTSVGLNASIGFGTIGEVASQEQPVDFSILDKNGRPARPIPIDDDNQPKDAANAIIDASILIPPFRCQEDVPCYQPERIRTHYFKHSVLRGS